jgi:hypothetical protein
MRKAFTAELLSAIAYGGALGWLLLAHAKSLVSAINWQDTEEEEEKVIIEVDPEEEV